mgnify:FL=1
MFPKSLYSLKSADYVVVLDKVLPVCDIEKNNNWTNDLYKKILNKGEDK